MIINYKVNGEYWGDFSIVNLAYLCEAKIYIFTDNINKFMTTIYVTVENTEKAKQLLEWLNAIKFVKATTIKKGNVKKLEKLLSTLKSNEILSQINDPVSFQKQLRNDW